MLAVDAAVACTGRRPHSPRVLMSDACTSGVKCPLIAAQTKPQRLPSGLHSGPGSPAGSPVLPCRYLCRYLLVVSRCSRSAVPPGNLSPCAPPPAPAKVPQKSPVCRQTSCNNSCAPLKPPFPHPIAAFGAPSIQRPQLFRWSAGLLILSCLAMRDSLLHLSCCE